MVLQRSDLTEYQDIQYRESWRERQMGEERIEAGGYRHIPLVRGRHMEKGRVGAGTYLYIPYERILEERHRGKELGEARGDYIVLLVMSLYRVMG